MSTDTPDGIDVYPVGLLADLRFLYGTVRRAPRHTRDAWRKLDGPRVVLYAVWTGITATLSSARYERSVLVSEVLVSALLAQLAELEEFARDAPQRRWQPADNYIEDLNGSEVATFSLAADAQLAALVADPKSVLRLCRAHRDIIEEFQRCGPRTQGYSGLRYAVESLARGLGVEETEDR